MLLLLHRVSTSKAENAYNSSQWHNGEDIGRAIMYHGTIQGKTAPRLRVDSGADGTLVHSRWIPDGAFWKSQLFRNAWDDIRSLSLAGVQLAVGGKKYSLVAVLGSIFLGRRQEEGSSQSLDTEESSQSLDMEESRELSGA